MADKKIPVRRHQRKSGPVDKYERGRPTRASEQLAGHPPLALLPQDPTQDEFPGEPLSSRRVEHPEPHAARIERLIAQLDPDLSQRARAMAVCTIERDYWLAQKGTRHRAHADAVRAMARRELAAHEAASRPTSELTAPAAWGDGDDAA